MIWIYGVHIIYYIIRRELNGDDDDGRDPINISKLKSFN